MSEVFTVERPIRFSHCDPAAIVYFPNFFDLINSLVEDWFDQALGLSFAEMHMDKHFGFPVVSTHCEFIRPCRLGERLTLSLAIRKLGRSSVELAIAGTVGGETRFRGSHKIALMSLETYRADAIPDNLRERMAPYVAAAAV